MKQAARFLVLAGALGIGFFFVGATPRDVTLVYDLGPMGVRRVDVAIERAGETVRRAELRLGPGDPHAVHRVRLTDGSYHVRLELSGPGGTRRLDREVTVTESGTIVLPLADARSAVTRPPGAHAVR